MHRPVLRVVRRRVEVADEDAHIVLVFLLPLLEELGATEGLLPALLGELLQVELVLEAAAGDVGAHHIHSGIVLVLFVAHLHPNHRALRQWSVAPPLPPLEADVARDRLHTLFQNRPAASPPHIHLVAEQLIAQFLWTGTYRRLVIVDHLPHGLRDACTPSTSTQVVAELAKHIFRHDALLHSDDVRTAVSADAQNVFKALCSFLLVLRVAREELQVHAYQVELFRRARLGKKGRALTWNSEAPRTAARNAIPGTEDKRHGPRRGERGSETS
mmetsp:Transcript_33130/g.95126  ORF Transcript_33130/g.95126 Transcript_33130/m.95126 type:complete len:272 (+) Transcript_33130:671-1486(+)